MKVTAPRHGGQKLISPPLGRCFEDAIHGPGWRATIEVDRTLAFRWLELRRIGLVPWSFSARILAFPRLVERPRISRAQWMRDAGRPANDG
jgi:hypothetical protein